MRTIIILLICVAQMTANAFADGWTNFKENISALWEKGQQATKGEIISRETFADEMPRLITAYGDSLNPVRFPRSLPPPRRAIHLDFGLIH